MRVLLALTLMTLGFVTSAFAEPPQLSAGMGAGARIGNDVSPQNSSAQGIGQVYVSLALHPWSLLWEFGRFGDQSSSNGNYSVDSQSYSTMLWSRYEPMSYLHWSPYAGLGVGQEFTEVKTQFGSASDDRWADGGLAAGICGGVMTSLWKHWNIEGEVQMLRLEFANGFGYGIAARTGYTF